MDAEIDAVPLVGTPKGPVPVVLLSVDGSDEEVVPIFVGLDEARSIARGLDAEDIGRPLTHDLLLDVVEELGGRVERVEVTEITDDGTYIADLHVQTPRGETVVDARPSDSIALASRTGVPIEIAESVFEESRRDADEFEEATDIREIDELP